MSELRKELLKLNSEINLVKWDKNKLISEYMVLVDTLESRDEAVKNLKKDLLKINRLLDNAYLYGEIYGDDFKVEEAHNIAKKYDE